MKTRTSLIFGISLGLLGLAPAFAHQDGQDAGRRQTRQETLQRLVTKLSETANRKVLVVAALQGTQLQPLETAATSDNLEDQLNRLVKRLPPGASWQKVYLPKDTNGRRYTADSVAQLARAQQSLYGPGVSRDKIQIQGKLLAPAEAEAVIQTLGLEPVYVILTERVLALPGPLATLGGPGGSPVMDMLMKQAGVTNPKDIPSGKYRVQIPGADGTPQDAEVTVKNEGGNTSIAIRVGGPPPSN